MYALDTRHAASRAIEVHDDRGQPLQYMSFDIAAANRALTAVINRQRLSYARYCTYSMC